ncbi:MAG: PUR family DNA/RNA-binding protein [Flammeovirgaceae bacterium]|nr:PUR family DNA/RNA-binding protein [Flammeovirgaceae bacterium]MDW8288362.1 DUF3276 family protein [Flammeovirgaceae bacterium]
MEDNKELGREEIFSKKVRAGKRTYFFDVKATRGNDFYLTITESKKRFRDDGFVFEKHKIFLYKEDFAKFMESLNECLEYIKEQMPDYDFERVEDRHEEEEIDDELSWK